MWKLFSKSNKVCPQIVPAPQIVSTCAHAESTVIRPCLFTFQLKAAIQL